MQRVLQLGVYLIAEVVDGQCHFRFGVLATSLIHVLQQHRQERRVPIVAHNDTILSRAKWQRPKCLQGCNVEQPEPLQETSVWW